MMKEASASADLAKTFIDRIAFPHYQGVHFQLDMQACNALWHKPSHYDVEQLVAPDYPKLRK
jgi:hypothetical protein